MSGEEDGRGTYTCCMLHSFTLFPTYISFFSAPHHPPNRGVLETIKCSGGSRGGSRGAKEPPFRLDLVLTTTDDGLSGTPLSGQRTKKTASMAHLSMLYQKSRSKTGRLTWWGKMFLSKTIENGRGLGKSGRGFKIFAHCYTRTPLQEFLHPPLKCSC